MKKALCLAAFLVLAAQIPLWSYDTSPASLQVVPEAIWAPAAGLGTWVTELQVLSTASTAADVLVYFDYAGGSAGPFQLTTGLAQNNSVRFSNILSAIDALDPGALVYYGKVGALWLETSNPSSRIQVQAKTVNGDYGKTLPGQSAVEGNSAAQGRPMIIQDLVRNTTYRSSVGAYNTSASATYVVRFQIFGSTNIQVGVAFEKTLGPYSFVAFNPFTEAGVTVGDFDNCWITITVQSGGSEARGVLCYGSIANNVTNDTYALLARMGI